MEVLERLELSGDETVLDAGCGSGRVTAHLLERLPRGSVLAVDGSEAMVDKAREQLGDRATDLVSDLFELRAGATRSTLIFSTATFHWILDHERLFARLRANLRPGGRLVAQCGGEGNVARHAAVIAAVAARRRFASHLEQMTGMWNFAGAEETEARLRGAGFEPTRCWLEPKPVQPPRAAGVHLDGDARPASIPASRGSAAPVRGSRPRRIRAAAGPRLRAPQHRGRCRLSQASRRSRAA